MSDRAAGDTSAPALLRASAAANNNPLLSAAITNLTLDDFTHNAMLLPAASPFVPVAAAPPPSLMPPPSSTTGPSVEGEWGGNEAAVLVLGEFVIVLVLLQSRVIASNQFNKIRAYFRGFYSKYILLYTN